MKSPNGITHYTKGKLEWEIYFPNGEECCHWCPMLTKDYPIDRHMCRATTEYIPEPRHGIGQRCPLKFEGGMSCDSTT